jgi:sugar lactone lactonase YvrE
MLGGEDRTTLFMMAAEFQGLDKLDELFRSRTGKLLTVPAPAPGVGWP